MGYIEKISFSFDKTKKEYFDTFFDLFRNVLLIHDFIQSDSTFLPTIGIDSNLPHTGVSVYFTGGGLEEEVIVENTTGIVKESEEKYRCIGLDDLLERFQKNSIEITKIDHLGFNLPWFQRGVHPYIGRVRAAFSGISLYHTFPTGEPWDFILPGTENEINGLSAIDYDIIRKPKIEIVSFEKCSIPIIQFDVCCSCKKDTFTTIFPEGLWDETLQNIWIYVENPYEVDMCLVLNEDYDGDWSGFFKDSRIRME